MLFERHDGITSLSSCREVSTPVTGRTLGKFGFTDHPSEDIRNRPSLMDKCGEGLGGCVFDLTYLVVGRIPVVWEVAAGDS